MKEQVKLNVFYPYPVEKVWQALTDCRILNIWMMNNDFEPRVGHKFKFENHSLSGIKTTIHCEVVELDRLKRLVYTWQDKITNEPTLVIWTLTGVEDGTQLQLKHLQTGSATALVDDRSNNYRQIGNGDYLSGTIYAKRLSEGVPKGIHSDISFRNSLGRDRSGCFFYEKPIANLKAQVLPTIPYSSMARSKFFLLNYQDSKEHWNYRLNHQLLETLEQHCSCF